MNWINTLKKKPIIWLVLFMLLISFGQMLAKNGYHFWNFFSGDEKPNREVSAIADVKLENNKATQALFVDTSISVITILNAQDCDNSLSIISTLLTGPFSDEIWFYEDSDLTIRVFANTTTHGTTSYSEDKYGNTFELNIQNLDRNRTYYAARVRNNVVQTAPGEARSIEISRRNRYVNSIEPTLAGCGFVNIVDAIQHPDGGYYNDAGDDIRVYKMPENNLLTIEQYTITQSGTYRVEVRDVIGCPYVSADVNVTVTPLPNLSITETAILLPINTTGLINASSTTSGANITYTDLQTNQTSSSNIVGPFSAAGDYVYEVTSSFNGCDKKVQVLISVFDPSVCPTPQTRVYSNIAIPRPPGLGVVTNPELASDANTATHATLTSVVGLLGLGSSYIDLKFPNNIPAGTPITVKLGTEFSLLSVLSATSIYGTNINSSNNSSIASDVYMPDASILGLVNGANEYEVTFVPRRNNANVSVNGVRIVLGGLLNLGLNIKVFEAYYKVDNLNPTCANEIVDVLSGARGNGLDLLTATIGVNNPRNFMDADPNSFTNMFVGVGVAGDSYLAPVFYASSVGTDIIEIELQNPNGLLSLGVLNGLSYRRFNGDSPVENLKTVDMNLIGLTLLGSPGNRQILRIDDPVLSSWDKLELRLGGLVNVLGSLNVYKIERKPKVSLMQIDPANYSVCRGTTIQLNQGYCTDYKWYSTPTGTSGELSNTSSYTIPADLAFGEHTFYVQAVRNGCEIMAREAVVINVIDQPDADDITVDATITADCDNNASITPSNTTFNNEIYKFYTDQNRAQEITSSFTGHTGVTYTLDNNILTINDLDVSRRYYVAMEIPGTNCSNANGALKEVIVNVPDRPIVTVNTTLTNCGFVNLYDAITNFDPTLTYTFYTATNEVIPDNLVRNISTTGTYFVVANDVNIVCSSEQQMINVTIVPSHDFAVTPLNQAIALNTTTTINYTSDGTVTIYDNNGVAIAGNTVGPFSTVGQYVYTVSSTLGACTQTQLVTINVIDPASCYPMYTNVYATQAYPRTVIGLLGNIENVSNIVDANTQNYATLNSAVNLLGLGSVFVDVVFPTDIPVGKPVTVKLGTGATLLSLASGLSVQGINRATNNTTTLLGLPTIVNGRLLGLIGGENVYEFTFIPGTSTRQANGVRVALGGLVSAAESARVYSVHYQIEATQPVTCPTTELVDVLYGTLDLGLGVANALVNVTEASNLLDSNPDNYALMNNIVGVLTGTQITAKFATVSSPTDVVKIKIGTPGTLLNLSLLSGISVQKYLGSAPIGSPIPINSNLISLELLSGNQTAEIVVNSNDGPFDAVRLIRAGAVAALEQLRVYSFSRIPNIEMLDAQNNPTALACPGQTFEISMSDPCTTYAWYDGEGQTANLIYSGNDFTLPNNIAPGTYTYYIQAIRNTCNVLSRAPFTFTVVAHPTANDITVDATLVADCDNNAVIAPSNATYPNAIFRFYTDQNKTDEILTGYSAHAGISYVVQNNQLEITGLTQAMDYYVSMEIPGTNCSNALGDLKQVTVNPVARPEVIVVASLTNCGFVNLYDAITNYNSALIYTFYDSANQIISDDAVAVVNQSGTYYVSVSDASFTCSSTLTAINVTVTPGHNFEVSNVNQTVNINQTTTIDFTSDGTVTIYDSNNVVVSGNTVGPFNALGTYYYTVSSTLGTCTQTQLVTINVIDPASCPIFTAVYPSEAIARQGLNLLGSVSNTNNIVGNDLSTYATLNSAVGLLGLGSTYVDIFFPNDIPLGTPVTVKLGSGFGVLNLATGVSVQPITKVNNQTQTLGEIQLVDGNLLGLLSGENVYEYSYIPSNNNVPVVSRGVRVRLGSLVTLLESVRVYSAYYKVEATQPIACTSTDIEDVLYGTLDLGLGVANALVNVTNATNLLDSNPNNYATMNNLVGALAASQITAKFSTISTPTDVVKIKVEAPGTLLNLSLLSGVSVQKYLGANPVGAPILSSSNLISLNLLSGGNIAELTVRPNGVAFDGVRLINGGAVGLLEQLRVYAITREPGVTFVDLDISNLDFCSGQVIEITNPDVCTTYNWYDGTSATANLLGTGNTFTIPTTLVPGQTYTYYVQAVRSGCEVMSRMPFTFTVLPSAPNNALVVDATLDLNDRCSGDVVLSAVANASVTLTNPTFEWYSLVGGTQTLITGETSNTLSLTGLQPGSYTYYVGVSSDEYCMSTEADRIAIDFVIPSLTDPNEIVVTTTGTGCQSDIVTLTASSNYTNPVYTWYSDALGTQPITSGTVNGITYTVANNVLTISGLTVTNATFYVTLSSEETCANLTNLKSVDLNFNTVNPPVLLTPGTQVFCANENKTLADILFDQPNILWYDALEGGNTLPNSTLLVNGGVYYAAVQNATGCESIPRTQVTVTLEQVGLPTNIATSQDFCSSANPTVADLQTAGQNINWYDAQTGGTPLALTQALVNGTTYYATLVTAAGCEGAERLAVAVTIQNVSTPTTDFTTQTFCAANNPTIADLQADGNNIVWYDAPNGTALAPTTALVNGSIYYAYATATLADGTLCISTDHLAVTVDFDVLSITGQNQQTFCQSQNPTVADLIVDQSNVVWYDAVTGGTQLDVTIPLVNGAQYFADFEAGCAATTRFEVTVTIQQVTDPTVANQTQTFCAANNPTVADLQATGNNIVWYDAPNGTILPATTALVDATIYYGYDSTVLADGSVCLSTNHVTVTVDFNSNEITGNATQEFCESDNPTLASIVLDQTNIVWYDTVTGGTLLDPTTVLIAGQTYYADFDSQACPLANRFAVTITFTQVGIPTVIDATQTFCFSANATVADLQVVEQDVVWYTTPTGGTPIDVSTLLTDNTTYYAALVINGCEGKLRVTVQVDLTDVSVPTNIAATQTYCSAQYPTVANLDANGNTVVWKDAAGNDLDVDTALVNGNMYYAHAVSAEGCIASQGFEVTVVINTVQEQIEDFDLTFCSDENATIADLNSVHSGNWFSDIAGNYLLGATTALENGQTYYSFSNESDRCNSIIYRVYVTVNASEITVVENSNSSSICINQQYTYTATAGLTNYQWSVVGGTIVAGGQTSDNTITIEWTSTGAQSISLVVDATACLTDNEITVPVIVGNCGPGVLDLAITKTVDNATPAYGTNVTFTVRVENLSDTDFTNVTVDEPLNSGFTNATFTTSAGNFASGIWTIPSIAAGAAETLTITVRVIEGGSYTNTVEILSADQTDQNTSNDIATVEVRPYVDDCLTVYNEISPNGDGRNDNFVISCLEDYPNTKLQIFNRYGALVYRSNNYANDFNGIANVSGTFDGKELPSGTYFYILEFANGQTSNKSGWLYIMR